MEEQVQVGDRFPNLKLESAEGGITLRDRWRERPLIVAFMRHFGCSFCREHLTHLSAADEQIRSLGGSAIAIFQYDGDATASFCSARGIPFECLGDPRREAYARIGLGKGTLRQLMGWQVIKRGREAYRTGGPTRGAEGGLISLMPGTFVLDRRGTIAFSHYNRNAADNPPVSEVLEALRSLSGAPA